MSQIGLSDGSTFILSSQKEGKDMEVSITDNGSLLVKLGPTEKRLLNEIAFETSSPPEKTFATLAFGAIITENMEMKAQREINEHSAHWDR